MKKIIYPLIISAALLLGCKKTPIASFTVSPATPYAGNLITLDGSASSKSAFGEYYDVTSGTEVDLGGSATGQYSFIGVAGTYKVKLKCYSKSKDNGFEGDVTKTITILP